MPLQLEEECVFVCLAAFSSRSSEGAKKIFYCEGHSTTTRPVRITINQSLIMVTNKSESRGRVLSWFSYSGGGVVGRVVCYYYLLLRLLLPCKDIHVEKYSVRC